MHQSLDIIHHYYMLSSQIGDIFTLKKKKVICKSCLWLDILFMHLNKTNFFYIHVGLKTGFNQAIKSDLIPPV